MRVAGVALGGACLAALLAGAGAARAAVSYTGYIASQSGQTLTPFDTGTGSLGATIGVKHPVAVAITPDGSTAWVVNYTEGTVTPVDVTTTVSGTAIAVGMQPEAIAITPDGTKAYVANLGSNTVSVIDLPTRTVTATITVGSEPDAIVVTPDGAKVYVANSTDFTVTPITTSSNATGPPIAVGDTPDALAVSPDGSTVWVGNLFSNTIMPINTSTDAVGASVSVHDPSAIGITPDGAKAYVANQTEGTVTPVTLSTGLVGSPIPAGSGTGSTGTIPYQVAITPDGATAFVGNDNSHTITPVTVATDGARPNIQLASGPEAIAIAPDQAPMASFTVNSAPAGSPTTFDASASTVKYGAIVDYAWDFGDGQMTVSSTPFVSHVYSRPGTYTATVTETDTAGTSTARVFTGSTISRNGGPTARASRSVSVTAAPGPAPGRLSILTKVVRVSRDGDVAIRMRCPVRAQVGCTGTLTIQLARRSSAKRSASSARCARGCRPLGKRVHFAIAAGRTAVVNVDLSPYGRRLLALRRRLHATAIATTVAGGQTATTTQSITLTAPAVFARHLKGGPISRSHGGAVVGEPLAAGTGVPPPTQIAARALYAISCPSRTQCTAVGDSGLEVTFNPRIRKAPSASTIDRFHSLFGIACPSSHQCITVGNPGRELTFDPRAPRGRTSALILPGTDYSTVSCPSRHRCAAVGNASEVTFDPLRPRHRISTTLSTETSRAWRAHRSRSAQPSTTWEAS